MRKYLAALLLVPMLALAGCQSLNTALNTSVPNVVTQQHVYQAHIAYDSMATIFANYTSIKVGDTYVRRPLCLKGQSYFRDGCAMRSVVVKIQDINRRARVTLSELDRFELAHRGQATFQGTQLLMAAGDIVTSAKLVIATNAIK